MKNEIINSYLNCRSINKNFEIKEKTTTKDICFFSKIFAEKIGLNGSIILSGIQKLIDEKKEPSIINLCEMFNFWSEKTIRRTINILIEKRIISYYLCDKNKFNKTRYFKIL